MAHRYVIGVDQGSSGTVAVVLDEAARPCAVSESFRVAAAFPRPGWVEHDPRDLLSGVEGALRSAVRTAGLRPADIACCGLANQGETVIGFDRESGEQVYPAISWQDRRGEEFLAEFHGEAEARELNRITGLLPGTYFPAPKMRWLLENAAGARRLADRGRLCLATSDAWILRGLLAQGGCLTDVSTASRTLLFDIGTLDWHEPLLDAFAIPRSALPRVVGSIENAGVLRSDILGGPVPVAGLCVDQQASLLGHGCLEPGTAKITYGTGCFVQVFLGGRAGLRPRGLLTSVAWNLDGRAGYVADGGIYAAGSLARWLVEGIGLAPSVEALEALASSAADSGGVLFVPAPAGLAAPWWRVDVRASWHGLTFASTRAHMARAAMEAVAFRVKDVFDALDGASVDVGEVRVDGGMSGNRFLMRFQADLLGRPLCLYRKREATARGAALLAGAAAGLWPAEGIPRPDVGLDYETIPPDPSNKEPAETYQRWRDLVLREASSDSR